MKIAKLCINTWAYASRDKRELAACQELGAEVEVFAKGEHTGTEEVVDGFPVTRISTRPLGEKFPTVSTVWSPCLLGPLICASRMILM